MRNIAVMGAGGAGSYVGGLLTKAGQQVTLIDLWPAHIEQLKKAELRIDSPTGEHRVKVHILHVHEVARLHQPFDIVVSAVAGYDVQWAMMLMKPLLETLLGIETSVWLRAAQGEGQEAVEERIAALGKMSPPFTIPTTSMALHTAVRQRTEIEYLNGHVVKKGRELGIPTPLNSAVTQYVQKLERGEIQPGLQIIERILAQS